MKALKNWKYAASAAVGLLLGLIIFFPWDGLGTFVFAKGSDAAAENGIYISVRDRSCEGLFDKQYTYSGITADFPLFRFSSREVSVDPKVLGSLLHRAAKASVTFGRGDITPVTRQKLEWTDGSANISAGRGAISVTDIDIRGKFSARGFVELSLADYKISHAQITLKVPPEMDRAMQMVGGSGMFSVSKIKDGEWRMTK